MNTKLVKRYKMLGWFSAFWTQESFSGPARNAPRLNGISIKTLFEQRPIQVITVSETVVKATLAGLKPTIVNERPPLSQKPAIMKEFDDVFTLGYEAFFLKRKQRQAEQAAAEAQAVAHEDNDNQSQAVADTVEDTIEDTVEDTVEETIIDSDDEFHLCESQCTSS